MPGEAFTHMANEIARSPVVTETGDAPHGPSMSFEREVDVEVLVDGAWWPGYLRHRDWHQTSGGRWLCPVRFSTWESPDGPIEDRTGRFDEDHLRPA
jgi:hypothetical protein